MLSRSVNNVCRNLLSRKRTLNFTSTQRFASTLVLADRDSEDTISQDTRAVLTAAAKIGGPVTLLVTGGSDAAATDASKLPGVDSVLHAKGDDNLTQGVGEDVSNLVVSCQNANTYTHILAPSNNWSKAIIPRVGALLDVQPISEVTAVQDENTFERVFYAGNAVATVEMSDAIKIMTIRTTAFEKVDGEGSGAVSDAPASDAAGLTSWVSNDETESDRPDLGSARVVVSGGRGMKTGDNFKMLEDLADKLDGAVGASRAAVDAGMVPNDMQIGQTGKVVAPELYIAVGLSGAIQHLAGMKDSKTIVCINKDPEAPIFQVSDYGLEADLFKAVPELTEKL